MASVALGFRASNLTNRGTVTKWPYSVVRHPAYVSKVSCWWLISIALFVSYFTVQDLNLIVALKKSFFMFLSMLGWTAIYYFRALTEERHLIKDPEYQAYTQKVKYRFIPKVI